MCNCCVHAHTHHWHTLAHRFAPNACVPCLDPMYGHTLGTAVDSSFELAATPEALAEQKSAIEARMRYAQQGVDEEKAMMAAWKVRPPPTGTHPDA